MSLTLADIRLYSRDVVELNILLDGAQQSTDELIGLAMRLAVGDFNSTPPITQFTVEDFPYDSVLLHGTLYHLANSEAERQLRNQITYQAQGVTSGIDDKYQQYNMLAQHYKRIFETALLQQKAFINQEQAWGGMFSPYAGINTYNYRG